MSAAEGRTKILLVNTYTHENAGEAARQLCIVESLLLRMPQAELTFVAADRETRVDVQGRWQGRVKVIREGIPSASSALRLNPLQVPPLVSAYLTADAVVSVGGHFGQLGSLVPLLLGSMLRKRTVVCGASTSGPYWARWHSFLASQILNRTALILLREQISRKHLEKLRLTKPQIYLTADEAFLLEGASEGKIASIFLEERIPTVKPLIGINISRCPGSDRQAHEEYVQAMTSLTNYLVTEVGATVVLVPFCFVPERDDRLESARVEGAVRDRERVRAITRKFGPAELKGIIGRTDLFVGTRVHANILALSMGVPTLALSHHHKTDGIMDALGMSEWVCNYPGLDSSELITKVRSLWTLREGVRDELWNRMRLMEERASLNAKLIEELLVTRD